MKIAIVAPSPVPFAIGGAENLFWGLQNYINEHTDHQCELIKIASPESSLEEIINSYENFYNLKLDHFDCVISTKYPAWMVKHRNHVCYMLHRLRGVYDTYHFMGLQEEVDWLSPQMKQASLLADKLKEIGDSNLDMVFNACRDFVRDNLNESSTNFPGPFARWLIHYFDSIGLSSDNVSRYAAISNVVRERTGYFPIGVPVSVLYPPPKSSNFYCGRDDYLFTVSRLDSPKRIGMLVEAMRFVKSDISLLIAGTGPDEEFIKSLANNDSRIKFLGFVNDSDLVEYYANAIAVPFIPFDEDYGLITIEAMMSSKPVITLTDSGGPNEFVRNGETGFSVDPNPKAIAEKIDYLCLNRDHCREMGQNAFKLVANITWDKVVNGLLGKSDLRNNDSFLPTKRKKMVVAVTFPIYPPRGGGQSRVFHLYRNLAKFYDIEIVTLCQSDQPAFTNEIAPGLKEIRVPVSAEHKSSELEYSESVGWIPVTDIVMSKLINLTPDYLNELKMASAKADIVVASHPYLGDVLLNIAPNAEFWLEAHNVESIIKKEILPNNSSGELLLNEVKRLEGFCWHYANIVFGCTQGDLDALKNLYGDTKAKTFEVPNGVSIDDVPYVEKQERHRRKEKIGFEDKTIALFMGSWHGPNIEAVKFLLNCANEMPNIIFFILGSVCDAINNFSVPSNVKLIGVVDDDVKAVLLGTADVALNPMEKGSGSNLKMLDYFAAGIPVISTEFGMRGIDLKPGIHLHTCKISEFPDAINRFHQKEILLSTKKSRLLVEENYSWSVIAKKFYNSIIDNSRVK
jgi:glycosyltransferase involved in cell wall biosynthesis